VLIAQQQLTHSFSLSKIKQVNFFRGIKNYV
jgi:hypothetical protein